MAIIRSTVTERKQNKNSQIKLSHFSGINLEPVIQHEISQKEKNKYGIIVHIYGT